MLNLFSNKTNKRSKLETSIRGVDQIAAKQLCAIVCLVDTSSKHLNYLLRYQIDVFVGYVRYHPWAVISNSRACGSDQVWILTGYLTPLTLVDTDQYDSVHTHIHLRVPKDCKTPKYRQVGNTYSPFMQYLEALLKITDPNKKICCSLLFEINSTLFKLDNIYSLSRFWSSVSPSKL